MKRRLVQVWCLFIATAPMLVWLGSLTLHPGNNSAELSVKRGSVKWLLESPITWNYGDLIKNLRYRRDLNKHCITLTPSAQLSRLTMTTISFAQVVLSIRLVA